METEQAAQDNGQEPSTKQTTDSRQASLIDASIRAGQAFGYLNPTAYQAALGSIVGLGSESYQGDTRVLCDQFRAFWMDQWKLTTEAEEILSGYCAEQQAKGEMSDQLNWALRSLIEARSHARAMNAAFYVELHNPSTPQDSGQPN